MFAENISGNVLKYDTVGQFSKIFIKIFERTFKSVAGEDKLGKCSFKYFDEHLIILTYGIIIKNVR